MVFLLDENLLLKKVHHYMAYTSIILVCMYTQMKTVTVAVCLVFFLISQYMFCTLVFLSWKVNNDLFDIIFLSITDFVDFEQNSPFKKVH